jgi:hypothetical protein
LGSLDPLWYLSDVPWGLKATVAWMDAAMGN